MLSDDNLTTEYSPGIVSVIVLYSTQRCYTVLDFLKGQENNNNASQCHFVFTDTGGSKTQLSKQGTKDWNFSRSVRTIVKRGLVDHRRQKERIDLTDVCYNPVRADRNNRDDG